MAKQVFDLKSLMDSLDGGRTGVAFMQQLQRVIADCEDRPMDDKERKVTLEFKCIPIVEPNGTCDEIKGKFHVTSSVPKLRTKEYSFGIRKTRQGSQLVFDDLSDDDVNQGTLALEGDEE